MQTVSIALYAQAVPLSARRNPGAHKGVVEGTAPLLQLPHLDTEVTRKLMRKKVRSLPELQALPAAERRDALTFAGLTDDQVAGHLHSADACSVQAYMRGRCAVQMYMVLQWAACKQNIAQYVCMPDDCTRFTLRTCFPSGDRRLADCALPSGEDAAATWQVEEVETALSSMPTVSVTASCEVEGEPEAQIQVEDVVTCKARVLLSRPSRGTHGMSVHRRQPRSQPSSHPRAVCVYVCNSGGKMYRLEILQNVVCCRAGWHVHDLCVSDPQLPTLHTLCSRPGQGGRGSRSIRAAMARATGGEVVLLCGGPADQRGLLPGGAHQPGRGRVPQCRRSTGDPRIEQFGQARTSRGASPCQASCLSLLP
jgi:hypothetical protein